jgi:hypothetical protein
MRENIDGSQLHPYSATTIRSFGNRSNTPDQTMLVTIDWPGWNRFVWRSAHVVGKPPAMRQLWATWPSAPVWCITSGRPLSAHIS